MPAHCLLTVDISYSLQALTEAGAGNAAHVTEGTNQVRLAVDAPRGSHAAVNIGSHHIAVFLCDQGDFHVAPSPIFHLTIVGMVKPTAKSIDNMGVSAIG